MTGLKKNLACSAGRKRELIDWHHPTISVAQQCRLLGVSRSSLYYQPVPVLAENLVLMRLLDEEYTRHPFLGVIKLTNWLRRQGYRHVGCRRVRRLLRLMGLMAIFPGPNLSLPAPGHKYYPYLLRGVFQDATQQKILNFYRMLMQKARVCLWLSMKPPAIKICM